MAAGIGLLWHNQITTNRPDQSSKNVSSATPTSNPKLFSYQGQTGQTALSLLQAKATVELKQYSFGPMVVGINGTAATGNQGWIFYINGTQASMGAADYQTQTSDQIEWKLEELQY